MPTNAAITNLFIVSYCNFLSDGTFLALICLFIETFKSSSENWNEDTRLVNEVKHGNRDAYWRLFEKYHNTIYRYCLYFLSKMDESEDEARDTMWKAFMKCHENIYSLKEEGKFFWWLRKTAYCICMDILKEKIKITRIIESDDEDEMERPFSGTKIQDIILSGKNHLSSLMDKEVENIRRKILGDALNFLKENYRQAVILVHFEGCSYKEAAEIMGCKKNDIKRWVHRGLLKLREILKPYRDLNL